MKWESSKCTVICESQEEVKNENIRLYIGGGKLKKDTSATYLGLTMTTNGLCDQINKRRGRNAIQKATSIEIATRVNAERPEKRLSYILGTI